MRYVYTHACSAACKTCELAVNQVFACHVSLCQVGGCVDICAESILHTMQTHVQLTEHACCMHHMCAFAAAVSYLTKGKA